MIKKYPSRVKEAYQLKGQYLLYFFAGGIWRLIAQEDSIIPLVICENDADVFALEDRKSCSNTVA